MDNGSSHRGQACIQRLQQRWPTVIPVHTPVHASWLNQIGIYFSIVQRKVLTPNDLPSLVQLKERLMNFQKHYEAFAQPFQWKFTREDLAKLLSCSPRSMRLNSSPEPHEKYVTELTGQTT